MLWREATAEILDSPGVDERLVTRAYRELSIIHGLLGDTRCIVNAIRRNRLPVRRVLDIGCANGAVLEDVRRALRVEVIGIDVRPPETLVTSADVLQRDATRERLPEADVAFTMHTAHHLGEDELVKMIRNVGRYCGRFLIMDLVRHPWPAALFRTFVAPWVSSITREDGLRSFRRAYTVRELHCVAETALTGSKGRFNAKVAPLYIRQMLDIQYDAELPRRDRQQ